MSLVALQHGLTVACLLQWCKAYLEGPLVAVGANETVVPDYELQEEMRRIKQIEDGLSRKTLESAVLKEPVHFARVKKWIVRSPVLPQNKRTTFNNYSLAALTYSFRRSIMR